jgi:hypothetical protein
MIWKPSFSLPQLLEDYTKISEIEALRWKCWQPYLEPNQEVYPDSVKDAFDWCSIHFVCTDEFGSIIGANRITVLQNIDELPFSAILDKSLYPQGNIAYFSRLVVDPLFRKKGIKEALDQARSQYLASLKGTYGLGLYGYHRLKDVMHQGFASIQVIESGTECFFPYHRRTLHVMALDGERVQAMGLSSSTLEDKEVI